MKRHKLPESTKVALEKRHGKLFEQLADIFDDKIAGRIVWWVIEEQWR